MASIKDLFDEAGKAYRDKDFDRAIELYEAIQERSASAATHQRAEQFIERIKSFRDIRAIAYKLYGRGYADKHYILLLSRKLGMSESGVKKLWYYTRGIRPPVQKILDEELKALEGDVSVEELTGPRPLPDEAFENEPGARIDELYRNLTDEQRQDMLDRMERTIQGEKGAWRGWRDPAAT